ncbi:MAG: hypothetical protein HY718_13855 [Planctomycetes bacterium]|nr:hypothetical protein [Planctomycetota bacterium]
MRTALLCALWMTGRTEAWTFEDDQSYVIEGTGYRAVCSKTTGQCQFFDADNRLVVDNAAETYVGLWLGRPFSKLETNDEASILASQYPVIASSLDAHGDEAVLSITRDSPTAGFLTTHAFNRLSGRVRTTSQITYRQRTNITNELIRTGLPGSFISTAIDRMEPATLVNSTQWDAMDANAGWQVFTNTSVALEPSNVREGTGAIQVTCVDDNDGSVDYGGVYRSFPPQSFVGATHLSFWVFPSVRARFSVVLKHGTTSTSTTSIWFQPNQWSLFQWDFSKQGFVAQSVDQLQISIQDNNVHFSGPALTLLLDDVRFSTAIQDGLYTATANSDYWTPVNTGDVSLDTSVKYQGETSLKWSNINLASNQYLQAYTTLYSPRGSTRTPSDVSPYRYMTVAARSSASCTFTLRLKDVAGNIRYMTLDLVPNAWIPVVWDFKNSYGLATGEVDLTRISTIYCGILAKAGAPPVTLWLDDWKLGDHGPDCRIFDAATSQYVSGGRALRYSARRVKTPGLRIYADGLGADNIEVIRTEPFTGSLDAFMRHVDSHMLASTVGRNGVDGGLCYYKEQTRQPGEQVQGTIVFDFSPSSPEIIKSRYPRDFRLAYSISDDDFRVGPAQAYFCGTSDVNSPDYMTRGILGHNLMITKCTWYYLRAEDGGGVYFQHPQAKALYDLMYSHGTEIAMHTPGNFADSREMMIPALDDLITNYGLHHWVDHSSPDNPEDIVRTGCFPTVNGVPNDSPTGYYVLDLLKERNFDFIWLNVSTNALSATCNFFAPVFPCGFPLPQSNQILGRNVAGKPIWGYMRSNGNGATEFLTRGGGGNIDELASLIANEGFTIVYTHDHINYSSNVAGVYTLNPQIDDVFAWLEQQQNAGLIWVDTSAHLLRWLIDLENVVITDQQDNAVTVENRNPQSIKGVTLRVLNDIVQSATIDGLYQIYVNNDRVVLPELGPNEVRTVTITPGGYDSTIPRLSHVDVHVDVTRADYDAVGGRITVSLADATAHDIHKKGIVLDCRQLGNFSLQDNGVDFAVVHQGDIVLLDENHQVSYLPAGELSITWNVLGQNTLTVTRTSELVSVAIAGPVTVDEGIDVTYACMATYDDGSTRDVTALADWSVAAGPGAFSGPGSYAPPPSVVDDTPLTIHVSYTEAGVTRQADQPILVMYIRRTSTPGWTNETSQQRMNGIVRTLLSSTTDAGPVLYAGGDFTTAGGVPANHVARFDGTSWAGLATGLDGTVWTLAVVDLGTGPALYAGGDFLTADGMPVNHIARWDGENWQPLDSGTDGGVFALIAFDNGSAPALYAGGQFTRAGGVNAKNVARWDGTAWSRLGNGLTKSPVSMVRALAVYDAGTGPQLYAGGLFSSPAQNIARWNGASWSGLGAGASGTVNALTVFDDGAGPALYVGGFFISAGNLPDARRVARWNGSLWSALAKGLGDYPVWALTVFNDGSGPSLYTGGQFTKADTLEVRHVARWRNGHWSPLASSILDDTSDPCWCHLPSCECGPRPAVINALAGFNGALYVGGDFVNADCARVHNLARWSCPPSNHPRPDFNWDEAVNVADVDFFQSCLTGADRGPATDCCRPTDLDGDGDVDMEDFGILQRCVTADDAPVDPSCAD